MTGEIKLIEVKAGILADNEVAAAGVRERVKREKTFLLNLMAAPGAGKTSLILRTIEALGDAASIGVMEADIASVVDAEKVAKSGARAVQIRTGGSCHVEADAVERALDTLKSASLDFVFLENVGNLVCPAEFDTGALRSAMILSVAEGDDKPLKYPLMFTVCDILIVNKIDYLELSDFDMVLFKSRVRNLNANIVIIEVSCKTGQGIPLWIDWLKKQAADFF